MLSSVLGQNDILPDAAFNDGSIKVGRSTVDRNGWGLFACRDYAKAETVCYFHGRHIKAFELEQIKHVIQQRCAQYMMALDESNLCVPVRKDGSVPMFPPSYSGCLVNEASDKKIPNVMTIIPASDNGLSKGCPIFGKNTRVYDWPMVALQHIPAGNELLTCYGNAYGPRKYKVSKHCKACV